MASSITARAARPSLSRSVPESMVATANMPGFSSASGFGTRASTMNDRASAEISGLMALIRPVKDLLRERVDRRGDRLADADLAGLDAGNRQPQAERVDLEQRDDGGRGLHVLAERHAAFADVAGERRQDRDVCDRLLGQRQLRPGLGQRGARGVDVLRPRSPPSCVPGRRRCSRRRRSPAATRSAAPSSAPACSATRRA